MEADILLRGSRVERHKASGRIEPAACLIEVRELVAAALADQPHAVAHPPVIILAVVELAITIPTHVIPLVGLLAPAMRAGKHPLPLVRGSKLAVGIVILVATLREKRALTQPAEGRHTRLGFSHVTARPPPRFVPDEPPDGATLQVAFVVRPHHPERHSIAEVNRGVPLLVWVGGVEGADRLALVKELLQAALALVLGIFIGLVQPQGWAGEVRDNVAECDFRSRTFTALHRRDDRDKSNLGRHDSLHDFTNHGGVFNPEPARHGGVGNGADMLFSPRPHRGTVRRSPRFSPDAFKLWVDGVLGHRQSGVPRCEG